MIFQSFHATITFHKKLQFQILISITQNFSFVVLFLKLYGRICFTDKNMETDYENW